MGPFDGEGRRPPFPFPSTETEQRRKSAADEMKVPSSIEEHRAIKEALGFEEDNNEDIAYLNFPLIWPLCIVSALSLAFLVFAAAGMELVQHLSFERFALNQLLFTYGKTLGFCNNTMPYERGMWPSFLRQVMAKFFLGNVFKSKKIAKFSVEMKVLTNVCFRVAVCVPMSIRIFVAFIIRNSARDHSLVSRNVLLRYLNEISAFVAIVEVFSLSLFAIVTIRFDYPLFYNAMFGTFIVSATFYMFLRTMLTFTADEMETIETVAGALRLMCCVLFTLTASQLFQTHQRFIHHTGCHGYVRPSEALTEYFAILSYALFSLLHLVDMRNIHFICYPRSCSGECEPLRPENFAANGGKFAHCRAFEWAQRRNKEQRRNSGESEENIGDGRERECDERDRERDNKVAQTTMERQFPTRLTAHVPRHHIDSNSVISKDQI